MAEFSKENLTYFQAVVGASSPVTTREATGDKSVTLDLSEKSVLYTRYGKDTFTRAGGTAPDGKPDKLPFNVIDPETGEFAEKMLAIKYPKSKGYETRLYFNRDSGFYPDDKQTWFIFVRDGEEIPFIGYAETQRLENLTSGNQQRLAYEHDYSFDEEDELYLKAVASPQAQQEVSTYEVTTHKRDAALAAKCVKAAGYKCQVDSTHRSFTSAASGQQYVEVHHLIPISKSADFQHSLDVPANLIILCPNCHRAIHFGDQKTKVNLLERFHHEQEKALTKAGIFLTLDQLKKYYGI